jgi:preprotein translocase subunit SecG
MEGDSLERVIVIVAVVWVASALGLAWLAFLAPASMGWAVRVSLLLVASAVFVASTIALGGMWTAPVAALAVAIIAYFGIGRR